MPDPSAGHELMRRLTARNPTLSDTLLTGYGFPIMSVSAILSMWLRNHQSVTYARKRKTVITVRGIFPNINSVGISRIQLSLVGGTNHHPHTILIALSKRDKTT
ncbi:hypothetical protein PIB30_105789, partial [Stylosanthes scabra]|nr:hypothetical protein [Stylosanthes scabra]